MKTALAVEGAISSAIACSLFGGCSAYCSDSAESTEDEMDKILDDNLRLRYFAGSGGHSHHRAPLVTQCCPYLTYVHILPGLS